MVFFANSGVKWPRFEEESRYAGRASLEAMSRLWKVFAILEGGKDEVDREELSALAEPLQKAAHIYGEIAVALKDETVEDLSPEESDLAALPPQYGLYGYPFLALLLRQGTAIPIGMLYMELSRRAAELSSAIRRFAPEFETPADLAPQVFQMMKQWENLAMLARVIAVVNRRETSEREYFSA